uniref:NADH-ubiquinone oxidoreductase chain 6 n=1 Tax=Enoplometopus occidentalis TaxID=288646 RepID=L0E924_9EUCA|nr:NADH dehydrogenase subunit 6 [Enoplometopus occidentalis]AGA56190.1 NADH dehydrogenase subunit 6 [Enoplometopus occidentalis]
MKLFSDILFFILPSIFTLSLIFTWLSHPLSMGLCLLTQTILICLAAGLMNSSFWFSYILFLIFLGGMLVLFIYVASLASNEPFKFSMMLFIFSLIFSSIMTLLFLFKDPLHITSSINIISSSIPQSMQDENFSQNLISMIYNPSTMFFTMYMILYLLLTLIVIVKIINLYSSPLRLFN